MAQVLEIPRLVGPDASAGDDGLDLRGLAQSEPSLLDEVIALVAALAPVVAAALAQRGNFSRREFFEPPFAGG